MLQGHHGALVYFFYKWYNLYLELPKFCTGMCVHIMVNLSIDETFKDDDMVHAKFRSCSATFSVLWHFSGCVIKIQAVLGLPFYKYITRLVRF